MNFKLNSRPLFTIICKLKNDKIKTRDSSPLIETVLAGVTVVVIVFSMVLKLEVCNTTWTFGLF